MGYITIFTERISIHALREEGDCRLRKRKDWATHFYPRPPRGGRRGSLTAFLSLLIFLSTPSARRATRKKAFANDIEMISIHALREEGDDAVSRSSMRVYHFYPRPPRGGRQHPAVHCMSGGDFYPRPPRGGRLCPQAKPLALIPISIHALREEGDLRLFP